MAKHEFSKEEIGIISDSLETYKDEVKKLMKRAEKLGVKEAEIEALRSKVDRE